MNVKDQIRSLFAPVTQYNGNLTSAVAPDGGSIQSSEEQGGDWQATNNFSGYPWIGDAASNDSNGYDVAIGDHISGNADAATAVESLYVHVTNPNANELIIECTNAASHIKIINGAASNYVDIDPSATALDSNKAVFTTVDVQTGSSGRSSIQKICFLGCLLAS